MPICTHKELTSRHGDMPLFSKSDDNHGESTMPLQKPRLVERYSIQAITL